MSLPSLLHLLHAQWGEDMGVAVTAFVLTINRYPLAMVKCHTPMALNMPAM